VPASTDSNLNPPTSAEDEMIFERSDVESGSSDEEEIEDQGSDLEEWNT
jgi:hypothetical protein